MNPSRPEQPRWSRARWLVTLVVVFAAQVGLIFALGDRKPITPRRVAAAPTVQVTASRGELLALQDPTLFVLPHAHGFSADAWFTRSTVQPPVYRLSEPPRLLELAGDELGETFRRFMRANAFAPFALETKPAPELSRPRLPPPEIRPPAVSTLMILGDLAGRKLLTPLKLPNQTHSDLLTNTVVQVLVDADGNVFSALSFPPGSGSVEADRQALSLARAARFAPMEASRGPRSEPFGDLTRGLLVFEWFTVPPAATNSVAPP